MLLLQLYFKSDSHSNAEFIILLLVAKDEQVYKNKTE